MTTMTFFVPYLPLIPRLGETFIVSSTSKPGRKCDVVKTILPIEIQTLSADTLHIFFL